MAGHRLADHFLTCDCYLTQPIVAELYSVGEMESLKGKEYHESRRVPRPQDEIDLV
jgi:hypothetical protein